MDTFTSFWLWQLLGRLHPLIVHFPIGLLVVAAFLESLTLGGRRPGLREGIAWLVRIGAASAVLAAALGWLLATTDEITGALVGYHQWLGVATAVFAVCAAYLLGRAERKEKENDSSLLWAYRSVLTLSVLCLTVAGHLGASLTHGSEYLASALPWNQSEETAEASVVLLDELAGLQEASALGEADLNRLNLQVRQIFAHTCYRCHSSDKQEGDLRLDSQEGVMRGGEGGRVVLPGNAAESEIIRRLRLPASHEDAMPEEGDPLAEEEVALIELWINEGAPWADEELQVFFEAALALSKPDVPDGPEDNPVDRFVSAYFAEHDLAWPEPASDRVFVRRAYLDLIGLLPEPDEVDAFLADQAPNKRERLVDSLLARDEAYAQHWLSFWNDLLRNDYSGTGFITGGRKQITEWLYDALLTNRSYDTMVRTLLNPDDDTEGFIKGIEWRGAVNASQTTEMQAAQNVSQALLGLNLKCASCHNSFVSNWTLDEAYAFAEVFSDTTLEIYRCDEPTGRTAEAGFLYPELGQIDGSFPVSERLVQLADIMVQPGNGRLYRTIVNRLWAQIMGRGIIESVDEMDNAPWSQPLLDWLASDLIENGYDLKHVIRTIATSRTHSLPSVGLESAGDVTDEAFVFEGPLRKRLTAEQFADALSQTVAPVYAAVAFDPYNRSVLADWIWYPASQNSRNSLPEPGTYYFRHRFSLPTTKEIAAAEMLVTADHAFRLYLNGRLAGERNDWRDVGRFDVAGRLQAGANIIAVEAENEGTIPNPAGLLLSLKIIFADGAEQTVTTFGTGSRNPAEGENRGEWTSTNSPPGEGWQTLAYDDQTWPTARWFGSYADNDYWGRLLAFSHEQTGDKVPFARASLVELDPFLKALGRPDREIVTTSRSDEATLLQALELTNGAFLDEVLTRGAVRWHEQCDGDPARIVHHLYRQAFGRAPTSEEKKVALEALGPEPEPKAIEDLLWAVVLLPEYQLVY